MPKILVNAFPSKKNGTRFGNPEDVVYADVPVVIVEYGVEYESPLILQEEGSVFPVVYEKEVYEQNHEMISFDVDNDGSLIVNPKGQFKQYFKKGTDLSTLCVDFQSGQICLKPEMPAEEVYSDEQ